MKNNNNESNEVETEVEDTIEVQSLEDDMQGYSDENSEDQVSDDTQDEENPDDESKDENEETPKKEKKPRAKKRIQELAKKNKELERELEELRKQSTADVQGNGDKSSTIPDIDDFDSFDEYEEALEKYEQDKLAVKDKVDTPKEDNDTDRISTAYEELDVMLDDARDKYDDFDEVIMQESLPITVELMESLVEFDEAGEMLYYLANNPKKLDELAGLTEKQIIRKLGVLESDFASGKVKKAKKVKVSSAPDPIDPVDGGQHIVKSLDDDDLSYEEHEAMLNKSKPQSRGGWL